MASFPLVIGAAASLLGVWAVVRTLRNRPVILKQLIVAGVIEAGMLAMIVVALIQGAGSEDPAVFWGYVVTVLLLFPLAAVVAIAERTRWGSVALLVICAAVAVMQVRIATLWVGAGASV